MTDSCPYPATKPNLRRAWRRGFEADREDSFTHGNPYTLRSPCWQAWLGGYERRHT